MKVKVLGIITLLFFSINLLKAQKQKNNAIKWSVPSAINPIYPAFQLAYERQLPLKMSIQLEAGIVYGLVENDEDFSRGTSNQSGYKLRAAFRKYFQFNKDKEVKALSGFYTGLEGFLTNTDYDYRDYNYESPVRRKTYGANIITGYQFVIWDCFLIDHFWGFGIKQRSVVHEKGDYQDTNDYPDCLFCSIHDTSDGTVGNIHVGFRIGWMW